MKRVMTTTAAFMLLLALAGCSLIKGNPEDRASFYFSRAEFTYGTAESVIVAEQRDIAGHAGELHYLLSLYLMGPLDEELISPFPGSTKLVSAVLIDSTLTVEITPIEKDMTDTEFTLACACLSMTCLELTDAAEVTIISGERTVTMGADDLLLFDDPIPTETISEEPK